MSTPGKTSVVSKRLSLAILISIIVHFVILILMGLWTVYQYVVEGDQGMEVSMERGEAEEEFQEQTEEIEVQVVETVIPVELDRLVADPILEHDLPQLNARVDAMPTPVTPTIPTSAANVVAFTQPRRFSGGLFGSRDQVDGTLEGYFYDLKQNRDGTSRRMGNTLFENEIRTFVREQNWDRAWLDRNFFRAPEPLNTTQIFFPTIPASEGPTFFGVGDLVQEQQWLIHYKGQFTPPENGRFRFVGYAGEVVIVRYDGKVVLDGNHPFLPRNITNWEEPNHGLNHRLFAGGRWSDHRLYYGDWINFRAGRTVDLEILIGERGGGDFNAFLFIHKENEEIEMDERGRPIHNLFQTMPSDQHKSIPAYTPNQGPLFKVDGRIFRPGGEQ